MKIDTKYEKNTNIRKEYILYFRKNLVFRIQAERL